MFIFKIKGEEVGIVTSSIAHIIHNILQGSTSTKPTKANLSQLKQRVLEQFQADNIVENNPSLYEIIIKEGCLQQLLRRVLVMMRVRFIDANKECYSCSIPGYVGFKVSCLFCCVSIPIIDCVLVVD